MRQLVRQHLRFFLLATLAAVGLRLFFLFRFPAITTDSFVYGDIAKNWLQHGIYGLSGPDEISPTYIRLPGYPAFLAAVFAIFGMEHYRAVLVLQMFVDIGTCFLIADMARRLVSAGPRRRHFCWRRLSVSGQLCGRGSDRDAGNFLHRAGFGLCHRRADDAASERCGLAGMWARDRAPRFFCVPTADLLLIAIELYLAGAAGSCLERQDAGESPAATQASGFTSIAGWVDSRLSSLWRHWFPGPGAICTPCIAFSRWRRVMPMKKTNSFPPDSIAG